LFRNDVVRRDLLVLVLVVPLLRLPLYQNTEPNINEKLLPIMPIVAKSAFALSKVELSRKKDLGFGIWISGFGCFGFESLYEFVGIGFLLLTRSWVMGQLLLLGFLRSQSQVRVLHLNAMEVATASSA
ncbi:unnamed protein product, partial [Prunus brigantina]